MIEFLKVVLTPHIVWAGVLIFFAFRFKGSFSLLLAAITDRINNVKNYKKTKDGHELTFEAPQPSKDKKVLPNSSDEPPEVTPEKAENSIWPEDNTTDIESIRQEAKKQRAISYLWEYKYLNYFLVRHRKPGSESNCF